MTTTRTGRRMARSLATAIVAAAALTPLTQVAQAKPQAPAVPSNIAVAAGNKVFFATHAIGVQIYPCNATATGYAWGASTPRANLYNRYGKLIGTHFAGPSWQLKNGSTVVGSVVDRATVDATAIPWLLLSATPTSAGHLKRTTFIQLARRPAGSLLRRGHATPRRSARAWRLPTPRTTTSGSPSAPDTARRTLSAARRRSPAGAGAASASRRVTNAG